MKSKLFNNRTGEKAPYSSEVEITLDQDFLYAFFHCENSQYYSPYRNFNDPLYEGDVVELFIHAGEDRHYFEFEVSPNNAHFLADIYNDGKSFHGTLIDEDFFTSSIMKTELGYDVLISIPLKKIHYSKEKGLRLNAFRIETDGGVQEKHLFSLHPTLGPSFHVYDCLKPIQ